MTRYRSMTDDQMQAKYGYDEEPYVDADGSRWAYQMWVGVKFAPRPECIPSPDPLPYLTGLGGRCAGPTFQFFNATVKAYRAPRKWGKFTPDPNFVRSEVNPILAAFREVNAQQFITTVGLAQLWVSVSGQQNFPLATPEQVAYARRVLERLAAVSS